MSDIRALPQSVLQAPQLEQIQDQQQRQTSVDQRVAGQQFAERVDQRRDQVTLSQRVESDALSADGGDGGAPDRPLDEEEEEQPSEGQPARAPDPADPDRG